LHGHHGIQGKKRRKRKENWHQTIPNYNTHTTQKERGRQEHHNYHHCNQPCAPHKYDREANTLTCIRHASTTTTKPPNSGLKKSERQG